MLLLQYHDCVTVALRFHMLQKALRFHVLLLHIVMIIDCVTVALRFQVLILRYYDCVAYLRIGEYWCVLVRIGAYWCVLLREMKGVCVLFDFRNEFTLSFMFVPVDSLAPLAAVGGVPASLALFARVVGAVSLVAVAERGPGGDGFEGLEFDFGMNFVECGGYVDFGGIDVVSVDGHENEFRGAATAHPVLEFVRDVVDVNFVVVGYALNDIGDGVEGMEDKMLLRVVKPVEGLIENGEKVDTIK